MSDRTIVIGEHIPDADEYNALVARCLRSEVEIERLRAAIQDFLAHYPSIEYGAVQAMRAVLDSAKPG